MLAVTIVAYRNEPDVLAWALAGLELQSARPDLVLLHLNAAGDDAARSVRAALPPELPVRLSWSAENLGFSGAHNRLVATAFGEGAELVVVHNPDLRLAPHALQALSEAAAETGGLVGPVLELADPVTRDATGLLDTTGIVWEAGCRHLDRSQGRPLAEAPHGVEPVAGVSGACLAVPRAAYEQLVAESGELFDELLFAYREDAELGFRARLLDIPVHVVPTATGLHVRSLRGTQRGVSAQIDLLGVRNRFLIAAKYGRRRPGGLVRPLLRDGVVLAGVLVRERSSLPGVREAWRLRREMRTKGRKVLSAARLSSREAARL